jgi:hypothetical protein
MQQLFRVTCGLDAVVAVGSEEDAHAYAARHSHEVSIEPITGPEILISLDHEEATIALASLQQVLSTSVSGANADVLQALYQRLAQTLELLDEQERLLTQ